MSEEICIPSSCISGEISPNIYPQLQCYQCQINPCIYGCRDCLANYCEPCWILIHHPSGYRSHSQSEINPDWEENKCQKEGHLKYEKIMFCLSCHCTLCLICVEKDHLECPIELLSDVEDRIQQKFLDQKPKLERAIGLGSASLIRTKQLLNRLNEKDTHSEINLLLNSVDLTFKQYHLQLDQHHQNLVQKIKSQALKSQTDLYQTHDNLTHNLKIASDLLQLDPHFPISELLNIQDQIHHLIDLLSYPVVPLISTSSLISVTLPSQLNFQELKF